MSVANLLRPNDYDLFVDTLTIRNSKNSDTYHTGIAYVKNITVDAIPCDYILSKFGDIVFMSLKFAPGTKAADDTQVVINNFDDGSEFIPIQFLPPSIPPTVDANRPAKVIPIPCQVVGSNVTDEAMEAFAGILTIRIPAWNYAAPPLPPTPQPLGSLQLNIFGLLGVEAGNFKKQDGAANVTGLSEIGGDLNEWHTFTYCVA